MTEALSPLLARVEKLTGKEAHITPGWGRQYREALLPGYRTMEQAPAALQSILRATLAQPAADGGAT